MNSIPLDQLGIPEEVLKLRPPLTPTQGAARRRADEELVAKYPAGCYLAYTDNWSGEELQRTVVVASTDWDEYQRQLKALAPEIRERVTIDRIRDPNEGLRGLYPRLVEGD